MPGPPPTRHLAQQQQAGNAEEDIRRPHSGKDGNLALARQRNADDREEVVDENQSNGYHKAGALAAAPRCHAEGNTDQHQNQAGSGVRVSLVQFDEVDSAPRSLGVLVEHMVAHSEDGGVILADVRIFLGADGQG